MTRPILVALLFTMIGALHVAAGSSGRTPLDLPSGGPGETSEDEAAPHTIVFYGQTYEGDAFIWCLDKSGSMVGERLEILKQEVTSAIQSLSVGAELGLVAFSSNVVTWQQSPVFATPETKLSALAWVNTLVADGPTCITAGATRAVDLARDSTRSHRSMMVVSDGIPYCNGQIQTELALEEITAANAGLLPIHTLFIGVDNGGQSFMQDLAALNEGTFTQVAD